MRMGACSVKRRRRRGGGGKGVAAASCCLLRRRLLPVVLVERGRGGRGCAVIVGPRVVCVCCPGQLEWDGASGVVGEKPRGAKKQRAATDADLVVPRSTFNHTHVVPRRSFSPTYTSWTGGRSKRRRFKSSFWVSKSPRSSPRSVRSAAGLDNAFSQHHARHKAKKKTAATATAPPRSPPPPPPPPPTLAAAFLHPPTPAPSTRLHASSSSSPSYLEWLGRQVELKLRPQPYQGLRLRIEKDLAVLLMRSSYEVRAVFLLPIPP